jgi:hypothetical protein
MGNMTMKPLLVAALALAALTPALPAPALAAANVPTKVGQCVQTSLKEVGTRLEGVPDSGSAVIYTNGIFGIDYETVKAITKARVGDKITLCLTSIPKHCPPGDDRGRFYSAVDLRTKGKWNLPDAEHMCGGA